jgi:hypothetical protein
MAATPIMFSSFDPSALVFSEMKRNTSGGKTIYIRRGPNTPAIFELPVMRAPFGLSSFTDQKTGKTSYSVDLSIEDQDFLKFVTSVEEAALKHIMDNAVDCLGKVYSREVIESALFKSCLRHGKEPGKYPPTMKLKVLTGRDDSFVPKAYNTERETVSLDDLQKGQKVRTIVDINQIWIVDNKFGITVRLNQIMMYPSNSLPDCAFSAPDEGEIVSENDDV